MAQNLTSIVKSNYIFSKFRLLIYIYIYTLVCNPYLHKEMANCNSAINVSLGY